MALMMFTPDKCELIRITNTKLPILYDYNTLKKEIKVASSVKYLGVYIDEHLTWKEHVKHTISKANTSRAFLQRNIVSYPRAVTDACYKIVTHPIKEYTAII